MSNTPQQKKLKEIVSKIKAYNLLYGSDPDYKLIIMSQNEHEFEQALNGAKALSYGEQYANDIACITLHQTFGFAGERQKRFCDNFVANYNHFREEERADLKDDEDAVYSKAKFEDALKAPWAYITRHEQKDISLISLMPTGTELSKED